MTSEIEHESTPPSRPAFPVLPIIALDPPPARSDRSKYGGLFYVGVGGLVVLIILVGWFAYGVWSLRDVWTNVYVLHDERRPEVERIRAAYALSRDRRVNQRQLWDICLRTRLPALARYVVAEGLRADAALDDPRGYGVAVARSEGWPPWLRLLLVRPIAYAAAQGSPVDRAALNELCESSDPAVGLWARFALAASADGDAESGAILEREADRAGPDQELARLLLEALGARYNARNERLDEATAWLRTHHPAAAKVWKGWDVREGALVRSETPDAP
jgi:hypothetical protein